MPSLPIDPTTLLLQFSPDDIQKRFGAGWAAAYFFGIIFLAFALLLCVLFALDRKAHLKRKLRRQEWGRKYGLELQDTPEMGRRLIHYADTEVGAKVLEDYPYVPLFKNPGAMTMHILQGTVDGLPARTFEYKYITGSGKHTAEHHYTVVSFEFETIKPHTALQRYGWRDPLKKEVDIQTGRKIFDEEFYIYADAWGLLANEFTDELEKLFIESRMQIFVVADRRMLLIAHGRLKDEEYDRLFYEGRTLAAYFAGKR
jgi:hypothetical protein